MPYLMKAQEGDLHQARGYVSAVGNTECVEFVRQATKALPTTHWKPGTNVSRAVPGSIVPGTAIATFVNGKYPTDRLGKHAAIYLSHDKNSIQVLDQWNEQGKVEKRQIRFNNNRPGATRSDEGNWFYVIE